MNGCISPQVPPLPPGSAEPIGGGGAHGWDVASAGVVSGLECERPTIGTTERSVIGRLDPGIPSLSFSPPSGLLLTDSSRARPPRPRPSSSTGQLGAAAWLTTGRGGFFFPSTCAEVVREPGSREEYAGIRPVTLAPLSRSCLSPSAPPRDHGAIEERGNRTNSPRGSEPGGGHGHTHRRGLLEFPTGVIVPFRLGEPRGPRPLFISEEEFPRTVSHVHTRSPLARRRAE
ncbi:unnamed protein product [Pleuronectes platessa]|uniref:Uncharacterized protein n=1 Tax=Pleuronectes platessa TaxID=8262 RepID=A0A9N7YR58_PLEPL|nr:unnamed protein product [Pleuronectes platessa]